MAVLKFKNVGADPKLTSLEQGIGESALTLLAGASKDVSLIERADIDSDIKEIDRAGDFHRAREAAEAALGKVKRGMPVLAPRRTLGSGHNHGAVAVGDADRRGLDTGEVHDDLDAVLGVEDVHRRHGVAGGGLPLGELVRQPAGAPARIGRGVAAFEEDTGHCSRHSSSSEGA